MKWIPITERLPELDRPLLVTIQYESMDTVEVTETELFNDPTSSINPCFNMGSAKNYKIFSWCYLPKPDTKTTSHIEYHDMEWRNGNWDIPRTIRRS